MISRKFFVVSVALVVTSVIGLLNAGYLHMSYTSGEKEYNSFLHSTNSTGVIHLVDTYDSESSSFSDFLGRSDAIEIETQVLDLLNADTNLEYQEMIDNPSFIINTGDESEQICNSLSINENVYDDYIKDFLEEGTGFEESSFHANVDSVIPVILGENLKSKYSIGDCFEFQFMELIDMEVQVIGFVEKGTSLNVFGEQTELDSYVILPNIDAKSLETAREQRILLSVQIEGQYTYSSVEEYDAILAKVSQITVMTGFQYVQYKSSEEYQTYLKYDNWDDWLKISTCIGLLGIVGLILTYRMRRKEYNYANQGNDLSA